MVNNHYNNINNDKVKGIICSWSFFNELKVLAFVLNPLCKAVLALERREANLGDCYFELACISAAIKILPQFNLDFRNYCIEKINTRFNEFDDDNYLMAFFLNPQFERD
jgi:hypothetical protein